MFDLPQPFETEQFDLFRKGISDDPSIDVYINANGDFAFLHPAPRMNYEKYIPRVTKFGLHEYKKSLGILERRLEKIKADLETGHQTCLEIGAGDGMFLKTIRRRIPGLHLTAMDKDQNTLRSRAANSDENYNSLEELIQNGNRYDVICLFHVLEHIEDDVSELANAHRALNRDGHLLLFVPALPWLYSDLDKQVGHLRRYVKRDLIDLTQKAGFNILKVRYFDIAGILPWYVNFVLLKNTMGGGSIFLYDRLIVPLMRFIEGIVPPPIGKNILLIAQKA